MERGAGAPRATRPDGPADRTAGRRRRRPRARLLDARVGSGRAPALPTNRGTLVGLLGVFLYAAGANVASAWTLVAAAACVGAVAWALLVVHLAARRVGATRNLPPLATTGAGAEVVVEVDVPSPCVVHVVDPATGLVGVLDRGATQVTATLTLPRGRVGGGTLALRCTDPLGLAATWRLADAPGTALVRPGPAALPRGAAADLHGGGDRDEDGDVAADAVGVGGELVGLRAHRSGDPLAAVHWRATARRGTLVSRDSRAPRHVGRDVVLAAGAWERPALDLACGIAVALADRSTAAGQAVAVCADGARLPWGPSARAHLATLPPAAGVPPRELAVAAPDPRADRVLLLPVDGAVELRAPGSAPVRVPLRTAVAGT